MSSSSSSSMLVSAAVELVPVLEHEDQVVEDEQVQEEEVPIDKCLCAQCLCAKNSKVQLSEASEASERVLEEEDRFAAREEQLRIEYEERMAEEINNLKARFELILLNEQVRTSCLLREAQWQKQEKIAALKNQLECKNLATLMHLLCSERKKNKHEIKRIIDDFTEHINQLTEMITEGQGLMEQMINGYKAASQVDEEWRNKAKSIIKQFQLFIEHYFGNLPDASKFFFNLPELLKVCSPLNPEELPVEKVPCPCDTTEGQGKPVNEDWWTKMDNPDKPFVVFGDMEYFHPSVRRELLKKIKNDKEPPPEKWKEYAFNNRFLLSECPNLDFVKAKYLKYTPLYKHYCGQSKAVQVEGLVSGDGLHCTGDSSDIGCVHMGSILRLITATKYGSPKMINKASILGARDSLELLSNTKLSNKEKRRSSEFSEEIVQKEFRKKKASLAVDAISNQFPESSNHGLISPCRDSADEFPELQPMREDSDPFGAEKDEMYRNLLNNPKYTDPRLDQIFRDYAAKLKAEEEAAEAFARMVPHQDSLVLMSSRSYNHSDLDKIRYEKLCPIPDCQRKNIDSLLRNLPSYLDFTNPYREYERTFENYEPLTKEQLERLMEIRPGVDKDKLEQLSDEMECKPSGIFVQTSDVSICPCKFSSSSNQADESPNRICGDDEDKPLPVRPKKVMDQIKGLQMYDQSIETKRFKVIGEDHENATAPPQVFAKRRVSSIMKIMKKHPSMYSMFQANTLC